MMNEKIKQKAQELYPPTTRASEYVAFLRGARMVVDQLMNLPKHITSLRKKIKNVCLRN